MADHWGKIGCHFPAKTNPNADVWNIEFLPKGGSSTSVIDRVYMVPDGANITSITDLQHYIVWTTDVTLVPESDAVCIEFVPPYDIPLSNVAIFCNSTESSTTVNFAVYHESGLVVAKSSGDTVTPDVEKFGMTGQRRVTAVSGVTLKKGLKFDGIVLDPPSFARFKGGNFNVREHLMPLVKQCAGLLNDGAFFMVSSNYSEFVLEKFSADVLTSVRQVCPNARTAWSRSQGIDFVGSGRTKESSLVATLVEV